MTPARTQGGVLLALAIALQAGGSAARLPREPGPAPRSLVGPNLLLSRARLERVLAAIARGEPLFVKARDRVLADATAFLGKAPEPIVGVLSVPEFYGPRREEQRRLAGRLRRDARATHALALAFALSREERFAEKAREVLFAWVAKLERPEPGGDTELVISYSFPAFFYGYDLLRGLGRVSEAEHARFVRWLGPFVRVHLGEVAFANNHHAWQSLFLATAAHVTEDGALFARAVRQYRDGLEVQIASDGALWRELVRGKRAGTYTLMALEAMAQLVHVAEAHGYRDLRELRSRPRGLAAEVALRACSRLSEPGVPREGGDLRAAFLGLGSFVREREAWRSRYASVLRADALAGPERPDEWGYLFEVAWAWWQDPELLPLLDAAPYGLAPGRCYTLAYATLHFRPV